MPMTRDNVFNLEQYGKGYVYGICDSLGNDPRALCEQLRTVLRFVGDVIASDWTVPAAYLENEVTTELASIVKDPTAFAVLELKPFELNEARYFLLKASVNEIIASGHLRPDEYAAALTALHQAFATLPKTVGSSLYRCLLQEFYNYKTYFLFSIHLAIMMLVSSAKLSGLLELKMTKTSHFNERQLAEFDAAISQNEALVLHQRLTLFVFIAAITLKILAIGHSKHRAAGTRPRLATAPTLMGHTTAQPAQPINPNSDANRP